MSIPLVDLRIKITPEIAAWLEVNHVSSGSDKSELAREILHNYVLKEIRASMLLHEELRRKGLLRDYEVNAGNAR